MMTVLEVDLHILAAQHLLNSELRMRSYDTEKYAKAEKILFSPKEAFTHNQILYTNERNETLKVEELLKVAKYSIAFAEIMAPDDKNIELASAAATVFQGIQATLNNRCALPQSISLWHNIRKRPALKRISMIQFDYINRKAFKSPQDALRNIYETMNANSTSALYKILSTIGWAKVIVGILQRGTELNFPVSGLNLAWYTIDYLNGVSRTHITRITLEEGTECIKHLFELTILSSSEISEDEKEESIKWYKEFLDIWKKDAEQALEQEGLLIFGIKRPK